MAYLALARAGFRRWSSYRVATVAGVLTNTAFGFLRVAILFAALRAGGAIGGYTPEQAATYTWLTQALIMTIAMWNWVDLATRIQTGDIVTDLQRPIDLQGAYLSEDLGRAGYQLLARGLPPFLIGALFYTLVFPGSLGQWCAFAVSLTLAVVVSFGMRFIVNLLAFWVLDWRGLLALSSAFTTVASGFAIPIAFFPAWAAKLFILLPWASMIQIPIDVFMGRRTGAALGSGLALQLGWAIVLLAAGRLLLANAARARRGAGRLTCRCRRRSRRRRNCTTASRCGASSSVRAFRGQLQYRTSFALNTTAAFLLTFIDFVVVLALFSHFPALGGLEPPGDRVALRHQRTRDRDRRHAHRPHRHDQPRHPLRPVRRRVAAAGRHAAAGDGVRPRAAPPRPHRGRPPRCSCTHSRSPTSSGTRSASILLPVGIVCGALIFGATFVLGGCLTFWTVGSAEVANTFTYGGNMMTSYPLNIFGPWLRRLLAFAVPLAFVTYFPGLYLLDKPDPLGFPTVFQFLAPVAAFAFAALTGFAWRSSVRHYRSTGS